MNILMAKNSSPLLPHSGWYESSIGLFSRTWLILLLLVALATSAQATIIGITACNCTNLTIAVEGYPDFPPGTLTAKLGGDSLTGGVVVNGSFIFATQTMVLIRPAGLPGGTYWLKIFRNNVLFSNKEITVCACDCTCIGAVGPAGTNGLNGTNGVAGPAGPKGDTGATGLTGLIGPVGPTGPAGTNGVNGTGAALTFADFYSLMPSDNAATTAPGTAVKFPQDGALNGITRSSPSQFTLPAIGIYQVTFQVSVNEPGQLVLGLDATTGATELAYTTVGRATGTSQIVGTCLVTTSVVNSTLTVRNPAANSTALTITPLAGGTLPVSAHLVIVRLQ